MSTSVSPWFDYGYYITNKLLQVQKENPDFTVDQLVKAFSLAGFNGEDGAEQHFMQYGHYEGVDPNPLFNAKEYLHAKAVEYYKLENPSLVTDLQIATMDLAISDAGMSPWTHYQQYGTAEGINASNDFNTSAYMAAKLEALNANVATGGKVWTTDEMIEAFRTAGLSALEHFMIYGGKDEGEVAEAYVPGKTPEAFKVPEEQKVISGEGGSGEVIALTPTIDILTGTDGDDVFVANGATGQGADRIDGGKGEDTYHFTGVNTVSGAADAFVFPEMKNIENVVLDDNNSTVVDMTRVEGLKTITMNRHDLATGDVAVALKGQHLALNNAVISKAGGDKLTIDSEKDTVLNMSINNLGSPKTGETTLDVAGELLAEANFEINGKDTDFTLTNTGKVLKTVNIKGDSNIAIVSTAESLATVNAAETTNGVDFTHTIAGNLAFTGGQGDDRLNFGAKANFDAGDVIDFGEGTKDTLAFDAASLTATEAALVSRVKGIDVVEFTGATLAASTGLALDAEALTVKTIKIASDITGTADAASITNLKGDGSETVIFASSLTAGGNGDGFKAIVTNGGGNNDSITFEVVEAISVVMGAGTGAGLNADGFEVINLTVEMDFTSSGGTVDTIVGTHAKITVSGEGDVDLGMVATRAGLAVTENNLNIDASALDGLFTVSTSAGKDTIIVGDGGSVLSAGKGGDLITLGKGMDILSYAGGDSGALDANGKILLNSVDVLKGFTAGTGGDVLKGLSADYVNLDGTALMAIANASSLIDATNAALLAAADSKWTAFGYNNSTYVVYDTDDTFDAVNGVVLELSGLAVTDLTVANFQA